MTPIMEGTRFDYYNALEQQAYPVMQIFKMKSRPATIFIKMTGTNPGWKQGQMVTFRNAQTAFSGTIWYIYKGSGYYNLYVKPPNYDQIIPSRGGEIIAGGSFPTKVDTGNGYGPGPTPTVDNASMLPSFINQRTLLIAAGILVVFIVIRKI